MMHFPPRRKLNGADSAGFGRPPKCVQSEQLGVFVYPKNQQSQSQQTKDENECYNSAKQLSGIDPGRHVRAKSMAPQPGHLHRLLAA
jgi:hypothetical protein